MRGVCFKCGCTEDRACFCDGQTCEWIDDQQDLCSRCARELMAAPLDNLSDALLVIRAMRAAQFELAAHVIELEQLVFQLGGLSREETQPEIWTPEGL